MWNRAPATDLDRGLPADGVVADDEHVVAVALLHQRVLRHLQRPLEDEAEVLLAVRDPDVDSTANRGE